MLLTEAIAFCEGSEQNQNLDDLLANCEKGFGCTSCSSLVTVGEALAPVGRPTGLRSQPTGLRAYLGPETSWRALARPLAKPCGISWRANCERVSPTVKGLTATWLRALEIEKG